VKIYYFKVRKVAGDKVINNPNDTIVEADWKSLSEIKKVEHAYSK
jgi:8-oxo-dGTP diphosphatase